MATKHGTGIETQYKYTESTGGTSDTKHTTRTEETFWTGKKYRKTE